MGASRTGWLNARPWLPIPCAPVGATAAPVGSPTARPFPAPDPAGAAALGQSVLFAVGEGFFLTGSAVFFTQVVGLSSAQVGLGLTIAGVVTFFFAVPLGRVADRVGPKRMWALGALAEPLLYLPGR